MTHVYPWPRSLPAGVPRVTREVLLYSAACACTLAHYSSTCSPVRFTSPRGGRSTQLYYTSRVRMLPRVSYRESTTSRTAWPDVIRTSCTSCGMIASLCMAFYARFRYLSPTFVPISNCHWLFLLNVVAPGNGGPSAAMKHLRPVSRVAPHVAQGGTMCARASVRLVL